MNSVQTTTLSFSNSSHAGGSHHCPEKHGSNNQPASTQTANIAHTDKLSINQQVNVSYERSSYQVSLGQSSYQQESFTYQRYSATHSVSISQSQASQTLNSSKDDVAGSLESGSNSSVTENTEAAPVNKSQSVDGEASTISSGASNILKHINGYISSAVESGASDEEVDKLISQGLAGFKQGYGEAEQILSDLGQLNDVVTPSINKLFDEVVSGIEQLREQYLPQAASNETVVEDIGVQNNDLTRNTNDALPIQAAPSTITPSTLASKIFSHPQPADIENPNRISSSQGPNAYFESSTEKSASHSYSSVFDSPLSNSNSNSANGTYSHSYERSENFSFSLTTQEGDKVTINADSFFQQDSGVLAGNGLGVNFGSLSLTDSTFFSIEGDINEDEALAINDLLDQVVALADEFYYGDVEKAFNQALEIGYDSSEIAAYMLDLQLTETQTVATAVIDDKDSQTNPLIDLPNELALMDRFVKDITNLTGDKNASIVSQLFDVNDFLNTIANTIDENLTPEEAEKASTPFSDVFTGTVDRL